MTMRRQVTSETGGQGGCRLLIGCAQASVTLLQQMLQDLELIFNDICSAVLLKGAAAYILSFCSLF